MAFDFYFTPISYIFSMKWSSEPDASVNAESEALGNSDVEE